MDYLRSKIRSWTERGGISLREVVDRALSEYGLDLAAIFSGDTWSTLEEWLNSVPSNVGRVRNINILIRERKYFQAAGDLRVAIDSTLSYQSHVVPLEVELAEKLVLLSNKLTVPSAHYELHQQHLRWLFTLKDLPTYESVLKTLTEEWVDFKRELRPYIERFRRNYITKDRMRYSPDHEPRTDDVSYDHTLVSREPYFDGSRIQINQRRYLATHVPESRNIHIFYRVLMSNRVRVIVNLTEPLEKSNHGYRYWPRSIAEPFLLESGLRVSLVEEVHVLPLESDSLLEYLTIRLLDITETKFSKDGDYYSPPYRLALFHVRNWEDYAIPNRALLLSVLPRIDDYLERSGDIHYQSPIAVHCHSGVGRTGTFMIVHSIFTRLKTIPNEALGDLPINIIDMLVALRLQREAVQSVSQLAFIFSCIRAYAHCRLSLSPPFPIPQLPSPPTPPHIIPPLSSHPTPPPPSPSSSYFTLDVIRRDEKFTRTENYYRLAAYMDSVGALQSQKEVFEKALGSPISNNTIFESFLQSEADRIGRIMFEGLSDELVLDWTFRLAKVCSPIHVFLFQLQQKGIGLKRLREIVEESRPITLPPPISPSSSYSSASTSTMPRHPPALTGHRRSASSAAITHNPSFSSSSTSKSASALSSLAPPQDPRNAYHLLFDGEITTLERIVSSYSQSEVQKHTTTSSTPSLTKTLTIPVSSLQAISLSSSPTWSPSRSPTSTSPRNILLPSSNSPSPTASRVVQPPASSPPTLATSPVSSSSLSSSSSLASPSPSSEPSSSSSSLSSLSLSPYSSVSSQSAKEDYVGKE